MRSELLIGRALKPRGLKGELKVEVYSSDPHWLAGFEGHVHIDGKAYRVQKFTHEGALGYVKLEGIDAIESAETLRGKDIFALRSELPAIKEGQNFIVDIVGLDVVVRGEKLGRIVDVAQYGSADVYTVSAPDKSSFSFPALKDLVKKVDLEAGIMELDPYLFDKVVVFN